jgi:hypothetical protein
LLRFHLKFTLFFTTLFALLILSANVLGSTQPIHPALRGFFEGCEGIPQPCWYGIVPGVMTYEEAGSVLVTRGFRRADAFRWVANDINAIACEVRVSIGMDNLLDEVTLSFCGQVFIGDSLGLFGVYPYRVVECRSGFYIRQGYLRLVADGLTIRSQVTRFTLQDYATQFSGNSPWRGFAPLERYRMLNPRFETCVGV